MFPVDWWVAWRERQPFKQCLNGAFALLYYDVVDRKLEVSPGFPSSWRQYTTIMRHSGTGETTKKRNSKRPTQRSELLGAAVALNAQPGEFVPCSVAWLEEATRSVCDEARVVASATEIQLFVAYGLELYSQTLKRSGTHKDLRNNRNEWKIEVESLVAVAAKHDITDLEFMEVSLRKIAQGFKAVNGESNVNEE